MYAPPASKFNGIADLDLCLAHRRCEDLFSKNGEKYAIHDDVRTKWFGRKRKRLLAVRHNRFVSDPEYTLSSVQDDSRALIPAARVIILRI